MTHIETKTISVIKDISVRFNKFPSNQAAFSMQRIGELSVQVVEGDMYSSRHFIKRPKMPAAISKGISPADYYIFCNDKLGGLGFHVPPVAKIDDEHVSILDVSNGGVFFDKYLCWKLDPEGGRVSKKVIDPRIINCFLNLSKQDIANICEQIAQVANSKNILLPNDEAANLLISPDGSHTIYFLDPMHMKLFNPDSHSFEYHKTESQPNQSFDLFKKNRQSLETFQLYLDRIRHWLI